MAFEKRIIGDCTLYGGDSLALLQAGTFGKLGAIVSDPPYGIGNNWGQTPIKCIMRRQFNWSLTPIVFPQR